MKRSEYLKELKMLYNIAVEQKDTKIAFELLNKLEACTVEAEQVFD